MAIYTVKALITDPIDEILIKTLREKGIQVDYMPEISKEELLNIIGNYDIIVVRSRTKVTKDVIEKGKKLKIIARAGIGLDNIDTEEAEKRNIKVVYAPGASTDSAVELTIGLMIAAARKMYTSMALAKSGIFKKIEGLELAGKTIGIVGFGRIGTKVGIIANAMGMKVLAYDILDIREKAEKINAKAVSLEELLKNSDVISLHVTVSKDAKPIIDYPQFELMKDNVIIVNTSRAVAVNGKALLDYIKKGKVYAYATDVFWNEPPKEEWELELLKHERVIVTTHIGAQTKEAQKRVAEMTTQNLLNAMKELGMI
ncbi:MULTISPECIES: D-2-hydroxyacid dehydrogenase [Sulfurisphaera]|uniref:D-3-phosphoglycerate dehydrogenase n=2 Tax=Sulfurisphaera tokodaii TaxID=111955 RepID=Q972A9_SULTO|nr:D-2-hydroxyacid dehydrogenase [Sulfurisphaera tokodaii]2EKL_A Chain A, D-3-phosphoglycerate dehydrogenase [Sulfurisphaera tokodaii]BAB66260.1 D-3-phosphoglycerate dehydrogenase [Sulfurisphaera tokodaii str. 7]HII73240.1 3-phosphoglycerate dehydrogenase [Sulfurisphaera tokodaii]